MACTRSLLSPFATGSSSRVALQRRALAVSSPRALRQPDEWSYPSAKGDNRPRRPFLNPDVSETIPNEVARRAGIPPYRQPSASLDPYELPPKLPIKHDILTHSITFSAFDHASLRPYGAMARHTALALLIPVTGPLPLPTELTRWSSNRSPFVHAKSKEIFERRVYRQRVDVWDADDKAAEVLVKVLLATGRGEHVKVKVEKFSRDRLDLSPQPAVAPLFHKTDRQRATVAELAARFVAETKRELAAESEASEEKPIEVKETDEDWSSAKVDGKVVDTSGSAEQGKSSTPPPPPPPVTSEGEEAGSEGESTR